MSNIYHVYWLPPVVRKNASTGETITTVRGPFIAQILGAVHRDVSTDEVEAYVIKMHGEKPFKIETRSYD